MTTAATSPRSDVTTAHEPQAGSGLAIVRLTIGAMFVWVFFENLGKGLYTPAGYAGLINYYIKSSLSFARTLHVSQHKRIAPITVRLIPRLLSGELKKKAGQTATNTTPRVTAIVCANCAKSEAALLTPTVVW